MRSYVCVASSPHVQYRQRINGCTYFCLRRSFILINSCYRYRIVGRSCTDLVVMSFKVWPNVERTCSCCLRVFERVVMLLNLLGIVIVLNVFCCFWELCEVFLKFYVLDGVHNYLVISQIVNEMFVLWSVTKP